jgi:uncharacterized protein (DUF433 family)
MNTVLAIEHIVSDPAKHGGKPRIADTGLTVQYIAELYNVDWSVDDLVENFDLTPGQVYAALSYYFDHRSEIDQAIQTDRARAKAALSSAGAESADEFQRRIEARKSG